MRATYRVILSPLARHDLGRLLDSLFEHARYQEDLIAAVEAIEALERELLTRLLVAPHLYRPAGEGVGLRELVIPGPSGGYVALFDIPNNREVTVLAVRYQLEDDYL